MSKLLDYTALQDRGIRYSKPHLWRLWTIGKFPKPAKLGAAMRGWNPTLTLGLKGASPKAIARRFNSRSQKNTNSRITCQRSDTWRQKRPFV